MLLKNVSLALMFLSVITCCSSSQENEPARQKPQISMMTYNIHHGAPANSEVVNLDHIADVIRQSNAELIALQEVDVNVPRSGNVNQAQQLAALLDMDYHFSKSIDYQGGEYGVAILSRYPLSDKRSIALPMPTAGERRSIALGRVSLPNGETLEFGSTHLDLNVPNRTAQAEALVSLSLNMEKTTFIGGDYNAEPGSAEITVLKKEYTLSCSASCPNSYPVRNPNKAIDFIAGNKLSQQHYSLISSQALLGQYASDHLPVLAIYQRVD